MTLKALMVDVDGVVVRDPGGRLWNHNALADIGLDPGLFHERFFKVHWPEVVMGRADLHERLGPVLSEIAPHLTSQAVADYWFTHDGELDHLLLEDLAGMRASGLKLHLATVQEHYRARWLWDQLGLSRHFDAMHYAADYGVGKPDPAFYRAVEARTGYAGSELLLIDDSLRNVEAALAFGWQAVFWDGSRRLSAVLDEAR